MAFNPLRNWFSGQRKKRPAPSTDFTDFLHQLGLEPLDSGLYLQAFRHRTAADDKSNSNERLEFVGDAILDAVVAAHVYDRFPGREEGYLSKVKSAIVSRKSLNKLARDLQLEQHIDAHVSNRRAAHVIGGNALEALIGAIYVDRGYDCAAQWVEQVLIARLDFKKLVAALKDPKSLLYELAQREQLLLSFDVESTGSNDGPPFKAEVIWDGASIAAAESTSKKEAEQRAARKALALINAGSL